jgi:hypothetical protein
MTGSAKQSIAKAVIASEAKQSIPQQERKLDCFVANAPRNDGQTTAISRRDAPEVCQKFPYPPIRGRRECRALDAPTASHAK